MSFIRAAFLCEGESLFSPYLSLSNKGAIRFSSPEKGTGVTTTRAHIPYEVTKQILSQQKIPGMHEDTKQE